jgi:hypothetical protein
MSDDVKLTLEGTINESAVKKTGTLEGKGTITIDVPDVTKTSLAVDYKDDDKVKLTLKSTGPIKLNADKSLKLKGQFDYGFLNNDINGNFGLEFVVSKKVAMEFGQKFGEKKTETSVQFTFKI